MIGPKFMKLRLSFLLLLTSLLVNGSLWAAEPNVIFISSANPSSMSRSRAVQTQLAGLQPDSKGYEIILPEVGDLDDTSETALRDRIAEVSAMLKSPPLIYYFDDDGIFYAKQKNRKGAGDTVFAGLKLPFLDGPVPLIVENLHSPGFSESAGTPDGQHAEEIAAALGIADASVYHSSPLNLQTKFGPGRGAELREVNARGNRGIGMAVVAAGYFGLKWLVGVHHAVWGLDTGAEIFGIIGALKTVGALGTLWSARNSVAYPDLFEVRNGQRVMTDPTRAPIPAPDLNHRLVREHLRPHRAVK